MKTLKMTAAAIVASLLSPNAIAATTTGTASATVIGNLSISQTSPLNFGTFSAGSTAGTINNFGVVTGGVSVLSAGGSAFFNVVGTPNTNFTITVPPSVTLTSGTNSMNATLSAPSFSALDNTGNRVFNVTGLLSVAANQPSGTYNGTYNVTANY